MSMKDQIENNFKYHAPKPGQQEKYEDIRIRARNFAKLIQIHCPHSRERELAMTKLEEAVMWANKSISCNE